MPSLTDKPDYPLTLRQADQARSDFAAIESDVLLRSPSCLLAPTAGSYFPLSSQLLLTGRTALGSSRVS
jgi:hypothetical protein